MNVAKLNLMKVIYNGMNKMATNLFFARIVGNSVAKTMVKNLKKLKGVCIKVSRFAFHGKESLTPDPLSYMYGIEQ